MLKITLGITMLLSSTLVEAAPSYTLSRQWASEPVLEVPECVLFRPADNLFYVSNVSGKPAEKNGAGFVSKMDLEGRVVELKWASGLNAPKGMIIHGDSLYVSDIDELVQVDLNSGEILKRYPATGAVFLNDVAADAAGNIYVGDSSAENGRIYRLSAGKLETWLKSSKMERPNGLHMHEGRLLAGDARNGHLIAIDPKTKAISPIAVTDSGIDGLKPDGYGNFFTSNWKGRTTLITAEGKTVILMDTTESNINSADFEYLADKKMLVIPTFFDNRVVAFTVVNSQSN
ncbi:hypothetical protein PDESU_00362 [Pontiella desulfatans]|uniref:SMP-30/Gluconolactonase/LRE-like region domain-containing protein n=1 Tax=Pontiella desulfatans TaxID=2750659 RepID=A0A6C2TVX1_PONDE|nr:SMP-30/gluconolactonase/LRE family protein [Pontiella desulfatans]VGO11815.1 hypothetical protein PDESU_00362 [Pontiella desulfatans]